MKPTLMILAAGMGSRYGGMKQLDTFGPNGECIMDYSVYDAIRAGFGKVLFVIRRSFEDEFRRTIVKKLENNVDIALAYQEMDHLPEGYSCPAGREKPWGTGHAIWVAAHQVREPFVVINADDFYGREAFRVMAEYLSVTDPETKGQYAMCGYRLANTLSDHGHVSRGVCKVSQDGMLEGVREITAIEKNAQGQISGNDEGVPLKPDDMVSMNFWGFTPDIFAYLEEKMRRFLSSNLQDHKAEFFIPFVVDELIHEGRARVKVLPSNARWFGVTYQADKESARKRIRELVDTGVYPERLF